MSKKNRGKKWKRSAKHTSTRSAKLLEEMAAHRVKAHLSRRKPKS